MAQRLNLNFVDADAKIEEAHAGRDHRGDIRDLRRAVFPLRRGAA